MFQKHDRNSIVYFIKQNYSFFHQYNICVIITYFFDKYHTLSAPFSQILDLFSKKWPIYYHILETKLKHFFNTIICKLFLLIFSIKNTILYLPHFRIFLYSFKKIADILVYFQKKQHFFTNMIWVLFLLISRSKIRLYILLIFLSFWIFFQKNGRHTIVFLKTKFYHFFHYDMDIGVIFTYFFDQKYCTISA